MARFKFYLFGPPRLERDGETIEINLRKALALLAYLAFTRQPHSRDALAALLWPEKDQQSARANLRRTLYDLGQLLGGQLLDILPESIGISADASLWVDADSFQQLASAQPQSSPVDEAALQPLVSAAELYTDDFLAGFTLPDCAEFDDWQFFQREELRRTFMNLLQQLVFGYQSLGKMNEALHYARRWLSLDPLDEVVQRRLMQLYAQAGQSAAALRQYEECVRILDAELGITPDAETTALYEAIRTRRFPAQLPTQESQDAATAPSFTGKRQEAAPPVEVPEAVSSIVAAPATHNLPVHPIPFVGREQEVADILYRLQDPACHLLTLIGPGGIGKTRLALEAAQRLLDTPSSPPAFGDGIFFVPLQEVTSASGVIPAIIQSSTLRLSGEGTQRQQLLNTLRNKQMLLILDNFEHLLDATELLAEILQAAPKLKFLVTSREALDLQEAWFYPIAGMSFPKVNSAQSRRNASIAEYDAVRFFVQCVHPVQGDFSLEAEQEHVIRICHLVGGTPLAIELAAAWAKVLPCKQIADEIERNLDILTSRHQNVPARHRSMRVVLEQTWQRLTEEEQEVLRRMAVFRGGCPRPAAEEVTGATLPLLTALVEKALLHLTRDDRYEIHELVRQFAEGQMQSIPGEEEETRARHCAYYTSFLQQHAQQIKGKQQRESVAELVTDLANVTAAWHYAVTRKDLHALEAATEALWIFSDYRGSFREGEAAFAEAVAAFTTGSSLNDLPEDQLNLVGFLLAGQGYLCYRRGDWREGRMLMERGIALLHRAHKPSSQKLALAYLYMGWLVTSLLEVDKAQHLAQESLALFTANLDTWGIVAATELLARIAMITKPLNEAQQLLQEGVTLSTTLESDKLRGGFLHKLGEVAILMGDYAAARSYLDEALTIAQASGMRPATIYVLRDLGKLAVCQGRYADAIQIAEGCLAIAEEIGPLWTKRTMLAVLAEAHHLLGNYAEAENHYQSCLQAARSSEVQPVVARCLMGLGNLALAEGKFQQAERLYLEGLAVLRPLGQEIESAAIVCRLGHLYIASGENRSREAVQCYIEALQIALKYQLAPVFLNACIGVAQLYLRTAQRERGLELLGMAAHHPASTYETQQNARRQLAEIGAGLAFPHLTSAQNQNTEWHRVAQSLLNDLTTSTWKDQIVIPHNLLPQSTPFVGRVHELNEILRCLDTPECRLLTIVGPGGIGKSRLALQAAQTIVDHAGQREEQPTNSPGQAETTIVLSFPDGVYFVPLQAVDAAGSIISAIAEATGFHFYSDASPRQQLLNYLRGKKMLLVLDSMEHLPEGAAIVSELLAKTQDLKILVTSQRSLNLHEEWFHPLAGMTLPRLPDRSRYTLASRATGTSEPKIDKGSASESEADAVRFFVQCARRARADFDLAVEREEVIRICRLVDGMPLAIELAATWLKVLSCKQIADEIERSLDILTARHHNVPANHRSMYTVLEQSWRQLLDEAEQAKLKQLSVIRGSFTQEAAFKIADASVLTLATFVEKALVWVTSNGRYQMHELLRQFAHRQLLANPEQEAAAKTRHSAYYLDLLNARAKQLISKSRRALLDEMGTELDQVLDQEIDNVRVGWEWAVQQHNLALVSQALEPLYDFYQIQSRYLEGRDAFVYAWRTLQESATAEDMRLAGILFRLLGRAGAFHYFLCEYDTAERQLREALAGMESTGQRADAAFILNFLGQLAGWQGEQERAKEYLLQSLAISREVGDKSATASALDKLANLTHATFGEYAESKELAAQSLSLSRELGRPDWVAYALDTLGFITFCLGDYDEAAAYYQESLSLFESIDDQYGVAMALGGMGLVLWAAGEEKSGEALDYFQRSLLICRAIGHQGQVVGRLAGIARIYNDLGNFAEAQQLATDALAIARELGSPVYLSHLLYCLGESAYGMGDLPTARRYLMEALRVTSETGLLAYLTIALFHYATLLIKESQRAGAEAEQQEILALELLLLVQRHPATWHVYRMRAAQLYVEVEARLPYAAVVAARTHAEKSSIEAVVKLLINGESKPHAAASELAAPTKPKSGLFL